MKKCILQSRCLSLLWQMGRSSAQLTWVFTLVLSIQSISVHSQNSTTLANQARPTFELGLKVGYDQPLFNLPYNELTYKGGRMFAVNLDWHSPIGLGARLNYSNIATQPVIQIPNMVFYGSTPVTTLQQTDKLYRNFVGLGPSYAWNFGSSRLRGLVSPLIGWSWINGGDALMTSNRPSPTVGTDILLMNTGFAHNGLAAKLDLDFDLAITNNLRLTLGLYYMRHFGVHFNDNLSFDNTNKSIVHGERVFDHTTNSYTLTSAPPLTMPYSPGEEGSCFDMSSVGINLGVVYQFGKRSPKPPKVIEVEEECITCKCPDDKHKVVVMVRDDISKSVIPQADVALRTMDGNIIGTGTTNSYGVVDFGEIAHDDYYVTGNVYGIETTQSTIANTEFVPNAIIQKEILYTDLRFILKGKTINKNSKAAEPNVIVSLTNNQTGQVAQDNSDGTGSFAFKLEKNSSYKVVGNKENRLSEIEGVSTKGLKRSTTLFVDLELGFDNFDCKSGTILNIKYALDSYDLTAGSKFELDRLVAYMKDHPSARVELSSHTDCRGTDNYNNTLSQNRAQSAVAYIQSTGIPLRRIVARGYGETRLLNRCADGVNCSESEHSINRRTEAKLICN